VSNVSSAALRLFDRIKPFVHERHYLVCRFPTAEVGDIGSIEKRDIHAFVGLSARYTRELLKELMLAGYVAYFAVGPIVKIAVNPEHYRANPKVKPSRFIVGTFAQHARLEGDATQWR